MRVGGWVWFVAGFAFCWVWMHDGLGGLFEVAVAVIGGLATFVLELPFAAGIAGVLILIGLAMWGGQWCSETARGKHEADQAWERRNAHR